MNMSQMTVTDLSEHFHMTSFNIQKIIATHDIQPVRVHINKDGSQTRYYKVSDFEGKIK